MPYLYIFYIFFTSIITYKFHNFYTHTLYTFYDLIINKAFKCTSWDIIKHQNI